MLSLLLFFTDHWLLSWYVFSMFYFWVYVGSCVEDFYISKYMTWVFSLLKIDVKVDGRVHFLTTVVIVYFFPGTAGLIGLTFIVLGCSYIGLVILKDVVKRAEREIS